MKRKLFLGLAALAALTITSCQKDLVINQIPEEQPIEFGTYVGRDAQTKASVTDLDALKASDKGFGVFAYYTTTADGFKTPFSDFSSNFMNNQQIKWNTTKSVWEYQPEKFWPNNTNDKLSFIAYAPYNNTLTINGSCETSITVPEDATNHVDFVYATDGTSDATNELINVSKQLVGGKVNFNFNHAMSRVGFKVDAVIDQSSEQVNGATDIDKSSPNENAIATGTTISVESVTISGAFTNSATLNLMTGEWTLPNNANRSYTLSSTNNDFESSVASAVTVDPQLLNTASEYLMLIPQSNVNVTISVTYKVTTTDGAITGNVVTTNNMSATLNDFDFEQGKAYNFVLHLGLTSVKFAAEVTTWDNIGAGTDKVVNVPNNN